MDMRDLAHTTEADYDRHFNLNVKGALFLVQKAVPHMPPPSSSTLPGGRVIFMSTGICTFSLVSPGYLLYAATKGAVDQLVRVLAKDLATKGITVNAVAPGPTGTDMFFEGKSEQLLDGLRKQNPFGRFGEPDEIARVVAFLAGEGSKWVSGQTIRVNGGLMV
jgi:3-oxoacyl-[acyl-carrier protein] reductase